MSNKYVVNGYVTVSVDDTDYNVSVVNGSGVLTVPGLASGNHPVYVSYSSDGTFGNYTKTRVTAVNVNVRSGPGTEYKVMGMVSRPYQFNVLAAATDGSGGSWYKLVYNGKIAYICAKYVTQKK